MRSSFRCCHTTPCTLRAPCSSHSTDRFPHPQGSIYRSSLPAAYWRNCPPYQSSVHCERSCRFRPHSLQRPTHPHPYNRSVCRRSLPSHPCRRCSNRYILPKAPCHMPAHRSPPGRRPRWALCLPARRNRSHRPYTAESVLRCTRPPGPQLPSACSPL